MPTIATSSKYTHVVKVGELRVKYNAAGTCVLRYYIDLQHLDMNLHKEIGAPDLDILRSKVDALISAWDVRYEAFLKARQSSDGKTQAEKMTIQAEVTRNQLRNILADTIKVNDQVDWERLKPRSKYQPKKFTVERPPAPAYPIAPVLPRFGIFGRLSGRERKAKEEHRKILEQQMRDYEKSKLQHETLCKEWMARHESWVSEQNVKRDEFIKRQQEVHADVDRLKEKWEDGDVDAILEHSSMVLDASSYPEVVPKDFSLSYDSARSILLVDYYLPAPDEMPLAKTIRFKGASGEFTQTNISKTEAKELYDNTCYQICLRTIHEIFEADVPDNISSVAFNGIVRTVDKATGADVEAVIISIMVGKGEFSSISLASVEPKACFKKLRGVSASSLVGLSPIPPLLQLDRTDKRFIEGREIDLGYGGTNLASMNWDDFEHLIRELFEEEFSSRGGEVRVTQGSADGGVDAVAFDPDPISGGKIVIQAKRYTRPVGVSAVRDLYGTTQAEGATKGILVTTTDFGPDAYRFAQGKPLTLLTGANLLHMLEKHGMQARIDIDEARAEMGLSQRSR